MKAPNTVIYEYTDEELSMLENILYWESITEEYVEIILNIFEKAGYETQYDK